MHGCASSAHTRPAIERPPLRRPALQPYRVPPGPPTPPMMASQQPLLAPGGSLPPSAPDELPPMQQQPHQAGSDVVTPAPPPNPPASKQQPSTAQQQPTPLAGDLNSQHSGGFQRPPPPTHYANTQPPGDYLPPGAYQQQQPSAGFLHPGGYQQQHPPSSYASDQTSGSYPPPGGYQQPPFLAGYPSSQPDAGYPQPAGSSYPTNQHPGGYPPPGAYYQQPQPTAGYAGGYVPPGGYQPTQPRESCCLCDVDCAGAAEHAMSGCLHTTFVAAEMHSSRKSPGVCASPRLWRALVAPHSEVVRWSLALCLSASLHLGMVIGWNTTHCATLESVELVYMHTLIDRSDDELGHRAERTFHVTCAWIGLALGAMVAGCLLQFVHRRLAVASAMVAALVLGLMGWLMHAFTPSVVYLPPGGQRAPDIGDWRNFIAVACAGRMLVGLGAGISAVVVPLHIADHAPPRLRGSLLTLQPLGIMLGSAIIYAIGNASCHDAAAAFGMRPPQNDADQRRQQQLIDATLNCHGGFCSWRGLVLGSMLFYAVACGPVYLRLAHTTYTAAPRSTAIAERLGPYDAAAEGPRLRGCGVAAFVAVATMLPGLLGRAPSTLMWAMSKDNTIWGVQPPMNIVMTNVISRGLLMISKLQEGPRLLTDPGWMSLSLGGGVLYALSALVCLCAGVILSDKLGRGRILAVGCVLAAVGCVCLGFDSMLSPFEPLFDLNPNLENFSPVWNFYQEARFFSVVGTLCYVIADKVFLEPVGWVLLIEVLPCRHRAFCTGLALGARFLVAFVVEAGTLYLVSRHHHCSHTRLRTARNAVRLCVTMYLAVAQASGPVSLGVLMTASWPICMALAATMLTLLSTSVVDGTGRTLKRITEHARVIHFTQKVHRLQLLLLHAMSLSQMLLLSVRIDCSLQGLAADWQQAATQPSDDDADQTTVVAAGSEPVRRRTSVQQTDLAQQVRASLSTVRCSLLPGVDTSHLCGHRTYPSRRRITRSQHAIAHRVDGNPTS
jgi:MFS family permease